MNMVKIISKFMINFEFEFVFIIYEQYIEKSKMLLFSTSHIKCIVDSILFISYETFIMSVCCGSMNNISM